MQRIIEYLLTSLTSSLTSLMNLNPFRCQDTNQYLMVCTEDRCLLQNYMMCGDDLQANQTIVFDNNLVFEPLKI